MYNMYVVDMCSITAEKKEELAAFNKDNPEEAPPILASMLMLLSAVLSESPNNPNYLNLNNPNYLDVLPTQPFGCSNRK